MKGSRSIVECAKNSMGRIYRTDRRAILIKKECQLFTFEHCLDERMDEALRERRSIAVHEGHAADPEIVVARAHPNLGSYLLFTVNADRRHRQHFIIRRRSPIKDKVSRGKNTRYMLSLIHISEPTRR